MAKQISFMWKRWMTFGALACFMFNASYLMSATIPTCPECKNGDISGLQFFHWFFSIAFGFASIAMFVATIIHFCDEK